MGQRLSGKIAAITGGASGIGAATARLFVAEGAQVVLGDLQQDQGRAFAAELGEAAHFLACDVTREDDVAALVDAATARWGRLDIMFNNAGIVGAVGPIDTTPAAEWRFTLDVLLNGVFHGMKHAARVMKPQRSGAIISMSSVAGLMGGLGPHAYAAAKSAVVGLTRNIAAELGAWGIRVNAIAPYSVATPMVADAFFSDPAKVAETRPQLAEASPLKGRPGLADDVANAALFLASDESGYTSGHALAVDAGLTTGARPEPPNFATEYRPIMREAGKAGLD